ncbi:hypothetical protein D3C72_1527470 [compost metagenome]
MRIAQAPRRRAGSQVVHRLVGQASDLNVEQGHIDMLATAIMVTMGEGGQNRHGGVQPGEDIGQCHTDLHRSGAFLTFRAPGQAHQPTQPLDHEVIACTLGIRPGLAEAGNRAIDKLRIDSLQAFIVQTVSSQATHLEVLDDHIGLCRQLTHQALTFRLSEINGHRTLVTVGRQVVGRLAGVLAIGILKEGRTPGTRVIASAWTLNLDHFSPEVSKNLPGPRPSQHSRQIQHPQMR